ncbi:MAG: hypothetical protein ACLGJC_00160 [Alphaproteobacteria bacterium]
MTAFLLDYLSTFIANSPVAAAGIAGRLAGTLSTLPGGFRGSGLIPSAHPAGASPIAPGAAREHSALGQGCGNEGDVWEDLPLWKKTRSSIRSMT